MTSVYRPTVHSAIDRDRQREHELSELEARAEGFVPPPPRLDLIWVGVDLDDTLAEGVWTPDNPTSDIGPPILDNVKKVRALAEVGYKIHIHTSRAWHDYEAIEAWCEFHDVPVDRIQCGKPLYAAYIDDRAIFAGDADWTPKTREARRARAS